MDIYSYRIDLYGVGGESKPMLPDIEGWDVEATDGHVGKVSEANEDAGGACLVVDTGFWLFGKKRMIPAGVVRSLDADDHKLFVGMTKDEIKNAPEYDPDRHTGDEHGYHEEVGRYYEPHKAS